MLEMWINGKLKGYFRCPVGFRNSIEYAVYYNNNSRQRDWSGVIARVMVVW